MIEELTLTEKLSLVIAALSAVATGFAAFATWLAPRAAARLAEAMRLEANKHEERRRSKLHVFAVLMQERAQIYSDNGVQALNLIDVVFNNSREVRELWSELFLAFEMKPFLQHVQEERFRKLLAAMAKDIGLSDELRSDDLGRVYFPEVKAQERFIADMQRQQTLANLQGKSPAAASAPNSQNTLWPPPPT